MTRWIVHECLGAQGRAEAVILDRGGGAVLVGRRVSCGRGTLEVLVVLVCLLVEALLARAQRVLTPAPIREFARATTN